MIPPITANSMTAVADLFRRRHGRVFATQDWHPEGHSSFKEQGGPWPPHCVIGSHGAQLHENLHLPIGTSIVRKGSDPKVDAYSGFLDSTLEEQLRRVNVGRLFVGGLATDYCVLNTVLDAVTLGFETFLIIDAIAAVNVQEGDGAAAIEKMVTAGAKTITVSELTG